MAGRFRQSALALVADAPSATAAAARAPAVFVVDDARRLVEANPEACELVGTERDELVGDPFDELIAPGMRPRLDHVWQAFAGEGGHAGPFTLTGGETEVQLSITQNLMPGRHLLVVTPIAGAPVSPGLGAETETGGASAPAPHRVGTGRNPSPREREVLGLLATGATDPQIADRLALSPATVQTHVRNAKSKLGARTRAQAVAMAIERGLIAV